MPALWVCLHMSTLLHALTSADWPLWCGFSAGVRWCGIIVFIVFYHRADSRHAERRTRAYFYRDLSYL